MTRDALSNHYTMVLCRIFETRGCGGGDDKVLINRKALCRSVDGVSLRGEGGQQRGSRVFCLTGVTCERDEGLRLRDNSFRPHSSRQLPQGPQVTRIEVFIVIYTLPSCSFRHPSTENDVGTREKSMKERPSTVMQRCLLEASVARYVRNSQLAGRRSGDCAEAPQKTFLSRNVPEILTLHPWHFLGMFDSKRPCCTQEIVRCPCRAVSVFPRRLDVVLLLFRNREHGTLIDWARRRRNLCRRACVKLVVLGVIRTDEARLTYEHVHGRRTQWRIFPWWRKWLSNRFFCLRIISGNAGNFTNISWEF